MDYSGNAWAWPLKLGPFWPAAASCPLLSGGSASRWACPYRWCSFLALFFPRRSRPPFNALRIWHRRSRSKHLQSHCTGCNCCECISGWCSRALWRSACRGTWSHRRREREYSRNIGTCTWVPNTALFCQWAPSSCGPWTCDCRSTLSKDRSSCSPVPACCATINTACF